MHLLPSPFCLFCATRVIAISCVKHYSPASFLKWAQSWKQKQLPKKEKNYCHINFYSNLLADFPSSFAGDQGSLPAPQPSIPQDSECWHRLKPGDLPLRILSLAGVSVRLIDSTQPSCEILGQERIRREKAKGDFNAIRIASRLLQFLWCLSQSHCPSKICF